MKITGAFSYVARRRDEKGSIIARCVTNTSAFVRIRARNCANSSLKATIKRDWGRRRNFGSPFRRRNESLRSCSGYRGFESERSRLNHTTADITKLRTPTAIIFFRTDEIFRACLSVRRWSPLRRLFN